MNVGLSTDEPGLQEVVHIHDENATPKQEPDSSCRGYRHDEEDAGRCPDDGGANERQERKHNHDKSPKDGVWHTEDEEADSSQTSLNQSGHDLSIDNCPSHTLNLVDQFVFQVGCQGDDGTHPL